MIVQRFNLRINQKKIFYLITQNLNEYGYLLKESNGIF